MSKDRGDVAEKIAETYIRKQQLKILDANYKSRWGEIDLIALDNDILVFIEIRYRKSTNYGAALETVDSSKQHRIIKTAQYFLLNNPQYEKLDARFDLIALTGELKKPDIEWFKAAFIT